MSNEFAQYRKHMQSVAKNISKMSSSEINNELTKFERMRLPAFEKQMVKGQIYNYLSAPKRKQLSNHFGNAPPVVQAQQVAAVTQAATSQAAASMAPVAQAPTVAPVQGGAAPIAPVPIGNVPAPIGVVPVAPVSVPQVPQQQLMGTVYSGGSYSQAAGAIDAAKQALMNAGAQLSAAQGGISGFGRYSSRRY
jgi:hypothetical protein